MLFFWWTCQHLKDQGMLSCDDMGRLKWGGSYRKWLSVDDIDDVSVLGTLHMIQTCLLPYMEMDCENKSSPDVKKIIVTTEGMYMYMYNPFPIKCTNMLMSVGALCTLHASY